MYVKILNFFKAGSDQPPLVDENQINKKYSKYRKEVLASIIVLYGFGYTCRLALSVVKKPLIDNEVITDETKIIDQSNFIENNSLKVSHGKKQHVIVKII